MLKLSVFCGKYLIDTRGEFPEEWFTRAKLAQSKRDCSLNFFGLDASQPLSVWQEKGWIHPDDPRGWFQWYCRYFMGRRSSDEDLIRQIEINCEKGDLGCRRRQRQALLHWAYDSRRI
jgi:hypothetical protein